MGVSRGAWGWRLSGGTMTHPGIVKRVNECVEAKGSFSGSQEKIHCQDKWRWSRGSHLENKLHLLCAV